MSVTCMLAGRRDYVAGLAALAVMEGGQGYFGDRDAARDSRKDLIKVSPVQGPFRSHSQRSQSALREKRFDEGA